jgi:hypothetical protein
MPNWLLNTDMQWLRSEQGKESEQAFGQVLD